MKVVSFNVNGIRARLHQIEAVIDEIKPDIIGIQEVKAQDSDFPTEAIEKMGYHIETFGQKGHYGVALLSLNPPIKVTRGFPNDTEESQKRIICGTYKSNKGNEVSVINGYFPQGDNRNHEWKFPNKRKFYADLNQWLNTDFSVNDPVMVMGDFNISSTDLDIGIGPENAKRWLRTGKCSFLPEEREWFDKLLAWGLKDSYRLAHPDDNSKFSWFDYRSKGFNDDPKRGLRIDAILMTPSLIKKQLEANISYPIRAMEKPSDHAPIWVECDI